ncbi:aspartyl protease-domain-containing protein [Paraphysoderma sedebokerense]|nr:aspartyl protease-domain-containing protein [Paraphysoderma sedebokerense]
MRLSFTTEQGDFHTLDVAPSLTLSDLVSLIEADSNIPAASQQLYHNGSLLSDLSKTLSAANIKNDDMLLVKAKSTPQPAAARTSAASSSSAAERAELLRQQILNTPALLNQIRQTNPQLVEAALNNPQRFAQLVEMAERQRQMEQAEMDLLAADPFDIEAQRQIEERIRQEQIAQNFETALEYNPEAFGRVVMLYINTEVNGKKVKAFVDSGAQV